MYDFILQMLRKMHSWIVWSMSYPTKTKLQLPPKLLATTTHALPRATYGKLV